MLCVHMLFGTVRSIFTTVKNFQFSLRLNTETVLEMVKFGVMQFYWMVWLQNVNKSMC